MELPGIELELEPGRRFNPTEEFLIRVLVLLAGGYLVNNLSPHMVELDLYGQGKEPWKVFAGDQEICELSVPSDPERKLREKFVITKVSKVSAGKTNVSRTAGAGTWLDKSKTKDVKIRDWVMGHRKTLTYEYCGGDGAAAGKSHYYLYEFQLSNEALQLLGVPSFDYVVCRVFKDLSKVCKIGRKRKFDYLPDYTPDPKRSRRKAAAVESDVGQINHVDPMVLQENVSSVVYVPKVVELDDDEAGELDVGQIDHVDPPVVLQEKEDDVPEIIGKTDEEDDSSIFELINQYSVEDWKYITGDLLDSNDEVDIVLQEKEEDVPEIIDPAGKVDEEDDSNVFELFNQCSAEDLKYLTSEPLDSLIWAPFLAPGGSGIETF